MQPSYLIQQMYALTIVLACPMNKQATPEKHTEYLPIIRAL